MRGYSIFKKCFFIYYFLNCFIFTVNSFYVDNNTADVTDRIYNAKNVPFKKINFYAAIVRPDWLYSWQISCGGVLIRSKWVLTPVQCIQYVFFFLSKNCFNTILHNIFLLHKSDKSNIETRKIGYGSVKLEQFTLYSISYIVVLKDYNPKVTITGDIALIYLEQMFPVEVEDLSVLNYERILDGSNGTIYVMLK